MVLMLSSPTNFSTPDAAIAQPTLLTSRTFGPSAPAFKPVRQHELPADTEPDDEVEAENAGEESIEIESSRQEEHLDGVCLPEVAPESSPSQLGVRARAVAMFSRVVAGGGRVRQIATRLLTPGEPERNERVQLDFLADLMNSMDEMLESISPEGNGNSETQPSSHRPLAEPDAEPSPINQQKATEEKPEALLDGIPSSPDTGTPYPSTSVGSPGSDQWTSSGQPTSNESDDDFEPVLSIQDSMPEVEPEPDMLD